MRIKLRAKLLVVVILGVLAPMEIASIYVLHHNGRELEKLLLTNGRIMCGQLIVTRRWLSNHGGVYVRKTPSVKPSPFINGDETATIEGVPLTLRSPETVTRELSEMYSKEGSSSFRLVSLRPVNPSNAPDPWEREALRSFERGAAEAYTLLEDEPEPTFRYLAPIMTEASCLSCHHEYGFKVGEVRGGISLQVPVGQTMVAARRDSRNLIAGISALGLLIVGLLWAGTSRILLRPLQYITRAVSAPGQEGLDHGLVLARDDELGDLAQAVAAMRRITRDYQHELEQQVESRTRELAGMQARLRTERDRLINLFDRMADGVCVASDQGRRIEYINPSLEAAFGCAMDNTCHQAIFDLPEPCENCPFSPDEKGGVRKREINAPHSNKVYEVVETELANPDGSTSWLLVFRDITERKFLENELFEINRDLEAKVREQTETLIEQERLAALGEVSAGLAHEIRNPLSAILSGVTLLESTKRTEAEREHIINLIKREGRRLNTSLTDFLLYARPHQPKRMRIDLNHLVREIAHLLEEDKESRGQIEIEVELEDLPPVWFDADQLRQLIWNVALNGVQAMNGKGRLTLRTARENHGWWRIEIQDTGPGIPEETMGKIFDPFFSSKKDGAGLGLSIVKRIATAHGGSIEVESEIGRGSRFVIRAPCGWDDPLRTSAAGPNDDDGNRRV